MNLRVDISLSKEFGVVERTVFRLVLNGYSNASEIGEALSLVSRPVVANGMRHLVNRQILTVNTASGKLSIAEPLLALLNMCHEGDIVLDVPHDLGALIEQSGILLDSGTSQESQRLRPELRQLKASLLEYMVPGVNLNDGKYVDYSNSFDFTLREGGRGE